MAHVSGAILPLFFQLAPWPGRMALDTPFEGFYEAKNSPLDKSVL